MSVHGICETTHSTTSPEKRLLIYHPSWQQPASGQSVTKALQHSKATHKALDSSAITEQAQKEVENPLVRMHLMFPLHQEHYSALGLNVVVGFGGRVAPNFQFLQNHRI